jgi:hypothetical protein
VVTAKRGGCGGRKTCLIMMSEAMQLLAAAALLGRPAYVVQRLLAVTNCRDRRQQLSTAGA